MSALFQWSKKVKIEPLKGQKNALKLSLYVYVQFSESQGLLQNECVPHYPSHLWTTWKSDDDDVVDDVDGGGFHCGCRYAPQ